MGSRPATFRKADLALAFEAAQAAGFDHVTITQDLGDGKRVTIAATRGVAPARSAMSDLEAWKADKYGTI